MIQKSRDKTSVKAVGKPVLSDQKSLICQLYKCSGEEILDRVLAHKAPRKLIRSMSSGDFFWMVKKVGDDDCLPLLEFASNDQWQYLLDMEIWDKDRLNVSTTWSWLKRLLEADSKRLIKWLFSDGNAIAYYELYKSIHVWIREIDEDSEIPEGFFTLDGVFYIKIIQSDHRDTIENLLRDMVFEDPESYQTLLFGLAGILPAELEEDMYRLRSVRLGQHGFLPFEESVSVYAPLDPKVLDAEKPSQFPTAVINEDKRSPVPVLPLNHTGENNILALAASKIIDPLLLDRIRLEFAGLCNQVLSADGLIVHELDKLVEICRKTAGYLNLSLETLYGKDISLAEQLLRNNSLLSMFRVGFGLVLRVKWQAERWITDSWFRDQGMSPMFWGEQWGNTIKGILEKRPRFYLGLREGELEYIDFKTPHELDQCRKILDQVKALDRLLKRLWKLYPRDGRLMESENLTFYPLLFNPWAMRLMGQDPRFSYLSLEQAKNFFSLIRSDSATPPYRMPGYEKQFIQDLGASTIGLDPADTDILNEALSTVWQAFLQEYEWVSVNDLDSRYSSIIWID